MDEVFEAFDDVSFYEVGVAFFVLGLPWSFQEENHGGPHALSLGLLINLLYFPPSNSSLLHFTRMKAPYFVVTRTKK